MRQGCDSNKGIRYEPRVLKVSWPGTRIGIGTGTDLSTAASFREFCPHLRLPRRIIKMLMKFASYQALASINSPLKSRSSQKHKKYNKK